jgi:hypothetical protein
MSHKFLLYDQGQDFNKAGPENFNTSYEKILAKRYGQSAFGNFQPQKTGNTKSEAQKSLEAVSKMVTAQKENFTKDFDMFS